MNAKIRPLSDGDVPEASAICRRAFATFFGLPDPAKFRPGADPVGVRRRAWPEGALAIEAEGRLIGAALLMRWGTVCILGPVVIDPPLWSRGLARALMPALLDMADRSGAAFTGLFTHPQSAKHIRLYEAFGFRMQRVTAIMAKAAAARPTDAARYSALDEAGRRAALADAAGLTARLFPGLDLAGEIRAAHGLAASDTLLLRDGAGLAGLAICHSGEGSEASQGQCLVKFAAAADAGSFRRLIAAAEEFAAAQGAATLVAGTNTGRRDAYALMQEAGFRTTMNGIAMIRPDGEGYNRPGIFAIDDWR
jgi:predicted N-acetyltransferase YhbS